MNQKWCWQVVFVLAVLLLGSFSVLSADQAIIAPSIDVYIITFGGGEGLNTFIKYNITPVPSGMVIDSVFLRAYVWEVGGTWDGDVMFCNVNDQAWTEADSSRHIINLPLSDSVLQGSGFGTSVGFTQSVDIMDPFLVDYNVSHVFCTIKLKDPDDGTFNPMPGSYPINSADTLGLGNTAMGFHIYFYPSEYVNAPPWLVVNYHATGVSDDSPGSRAGGLPHVFPNPFRVSAAVPPCLVDSELYDLSGRFIKRISGSRFGENLTPGIYFLRVDGYAPIKITKIK